MALLFTFVDCWDDGKRLHILGTYTASGSYNQAAPDNLDIGSDPRVKATRLPIQVFMEHAKGYCADYINGTNIHDGTVRFYSAAGTELATGAYPAAITGVTPQVDAIAKPNL